MMKIWGLDEFLWAKTSWPWLMTISSMHPPKKSVSMLSRVSWTTWYD
jgi:hypothetical protein